MALHMYLYLKINNTKMSIFEYLDIERMYHGRLSYMLLLQYAYEHDETIIKNLRKPTILLNEKLNKTN